MQLNKFNFVNFYFKLFFFYISRKKICLKALIVMYILLYFFVINSLYYNFLSYSYFRIFSLMLSFFFNAILELINVLIIFNTHLISIIFWSNNSIFIIRFSINIFISFYICIIFLAYLYWKVYLFVWKIYFLKPKKRIKKLWQFDSN